MTFGSLSAPFVRQHLGPECVLVFTHAYNSLFCVSAIGIGIGNDIDIDVDRFDARGKLWGFGRT